jgi:hypothetical protein
MVQPGIVPLTLPSPSYTLNDCGVLSEQVSPTERDG